MNFSSNLTSPSYVEKNNFDQKRNFNYNSSSFDFNLNQKSEFNLVSKIKHNQYVDNQTRNQTKPKNYLSNQKMVTFLLPANHRHSSSSDTFEYNRMVLEKKKLQNHRHLPTAPVKKYPMSTSLPVAKLLLNRDNFGTNDIKSGQCSLTSSPKPYVRNRRNLYPIRTSLKQSHILNNESLNKFNNTQDSIKINKPSSLYHGLDTFLSKTLTIDQIKKNIPICKSAPIISHSSGSSPQLLDSDKSLKEVFKNELKYFAEERKKFLQLIESNSHLDYYQLMSFNHISESDLNALLHLYSYPPDPVLEHIPPPGVANFQGIPQAYLHQNASLRFQERSPFFQTHRR